MPLLLAALRRQVVDGFVAVGHALAVAVVVDIDEVKVGAVAEFEAAQFAVADDGDFGRAAVGFARGAVFFAQDLFAVLKRCL